MWWDIWCIKIVCIDCWACHNKKQNMGQEPQISLSRQQQAIPIFTTFYFIQKLNKILFWLVGCLLACSIIISLLPISEFVLDEKFQRNDSKFAIFYIKVQSCFIRFLFRPTFQLWVFIYIKNMANFESFRWNFSSSSNSEIGRSEWVVPIGYHQKFIVPYVTLLPLLSK